MKRLNRIIAFILLLSFIFPLLADARAGGRAGGGYSGSRGSSFGGSYRSRPSSGGYYRPQPSYSAPYQRPYQQTYATPNRSTGSFFSGFASGILGAWLYNKIFSSESSNKATTTQNETTKSTATKEQPPAQTGGFFRIILLFLAAYLIYRIFKRRTKRNDQRYSSDQSNEPARKMNINEFMNLPKGSDYAEEPTIALSQDDLRQFENILVQIQKAWSQADLISLKRLTAPDLFSNFSEILSEHERQGLKNIISDVKLNNLEVLDVWQENNTLAARVSLTWNAIDYTVNTSLSPSDPNYTVNGNPEQPINFTEIWTLIREDRQPWVLADIEQV